MKNKKEILGQIVKGRNGAPDMTLGEMMMKWEAGKTLKGDLLSYYNLTEKQIYEIAKALKEQKSAGTGS